MNVLCIASSLQSGRRGAGLSMRAVVRQAARLSCMRLRRNGAAKHSTALGDGCKDGLSLQ